MREENLGSQIKSLEEFCERFIGKISRIPYVQQVLLVSAFEGAEIITVIDSEPFDYNARKRIYEIQKEILKLAVEPFAEFRLINLTEFDSDQRSFLIPQEAEILYSRSDVSRK